MREAEGVADLVGRGGLEVVTLPAGQDDLLVGDERHGEEDEPQDERRVVDLGLPWPRVRVRVRVSVRWGEEGSRRRLL